MSDAHNVSNSRHGLARSTWKRPVRRFGVLVAIAVLAQVANRLIVNADVGVAFSAENDAAVRQLLRELLNIARELSWIASALALWAASLVGAFLALRWALGRPIRDALNL